MSIRLVVAAALILVAVSAAGFYESKASKVVNLTPDNFDKTVLESTDLWLVEFYAPWCGHCKNLAPEWDKAAKQLEGSNVHIAAVDADAFGALGGKYGVQGYPTIKVFGENKQSPTDYDGQRQAKAIVDFGKKQWKRIESKRNGVEEAEETPEAQGPPPSEFYDGTDVVELSDDTFDSEVAKGKEPWLVEFYAPWCGHCKNLVPEWKKAASALQGSVRIGAIDATAYKKWAGKFNVNGFPTIKFIPPGNPDAAEDYNGGRSSEAIVEYGLKKAELYPSGPVVVSQIQDQAALQTLCEKKTLCVIFVAPHVIDTGAAGRLKLVDFFAEIAGQFRARSAAFGWIVGGEHESFEQGFGIHATYPTFVALNYKNQRATTHKGPFTKDAIVTNIKKIFDGKLSVSTLKQIPQLSKGVPLWDGKDYIPPADDE